MIELSALLSKVVEAPLWMLLLLKVTALLAAGWLLHFALRRANPRWRVLLWRGVVIGLIAMPVMMAVMPAIELSIAKPLPQTVIPAAPDDTALLRSPILPETPRTEPIPTPSIESVPVSREKQPSALWAQMRFWSLPAVWILGVAVLAFRFVLGHRRVKRLVAGSRPVPQTVVTECRRVAEALRCKAQVDVRSVTDLSVPFLTGLRRPVLLLPEHMCDPAYSADLPAILAHELSHLCSRDLFWGYVLHWISIGLWFHPLVWPVRTAHASACEQVSDAVSAHFVGDAHAYSRTLARVVVDIASRPPATAGIPIARTSDIARRLKALKRRVFSAPLSRRRVLALIVIGLLCIAILGAVHITYTRTIEEEDSAADIPAEVQEQIDRLRSQDPEEQADAAKKLGEMGEKAAPAVPYLIRVFRFEPPDGWINRLMRRAIFEALRLEHPPVSEAKTALEKIGEPAIDALIAALKDKDKDIRKHAADVLGRTGRSSAVEPLIAVLKDSSEVDSVRQSAARGLGLSKNQLAVERLSVALNDEDETTRKLAAIALGWLGERRVVEPLIAMLSDEDDELRRDAAWGLGQTGDSRAVKPLIAILDEPTLFGWPAALALSSLGEPALEPLLHAAEDEEPIVRGNAAYGLARFTSDARAMEAVIAMFADESEDVRLSASLAIAESDDSAVVEPLIAALRQHENADVRSGAAAALAMLPEEGKVSIDQAVQPLIAALQQDSDVNVRTGAAMALGFIKDANAANALQTALNDEDIYVRTWAALALSRRKDRRAIAPLIEALQLLSARSWADEASPVPPSWFDADEKSLREYVAEELVGMTGQDFGQDQDKWREWWEENKRSFGKSVDADSEPSVTDESAAPEPTTAEAPDTRSNIDAEKERTESTVDTVRRQDISPEVQKYVEMLASRNPVDRTNAARRLGNLCDEEPRPDIRASGAVELLIDALRDKDWGVRSETATALGKIGDARATLALAGALKDPDSVVRGNAAWALSQIKDTRAVEPLIAALGDEDRFVRGQAAEALGELGDSRAVEPLIAALKHRRWSERYQAATALGKLKDKRAVNPLIRSLRARDPKLRESAAEALGEIGDPRAVKPLVAALKLRGDLYSRDINVWDLPSYATSALRKIGEPAVEPLIPLLRHRNKYTRGYAAETLGQIGDSRAVEPLIARLRDRDPDVRRDAAGALGHIKDKRAVEPLIAALHDKEGWVLRKVAEALGEIGDRRAIEPLVEVLNDGEFDVRFEAAEALAGLNDSRGAPILIVGLDDDSRFIRASAQKALEKTKDDPEVKRLLAARETKVRAVAEAVKAEGIGTLEGLIEGLQVGSWMGRESAAKKLGEIGDARAVEPLIAALHDKHESVRRAAAWALGQMQEKAAPAVPYLIDMLGDASPILGSGFLQLLDLTRAVPERMRGLMDFPGIEVPAALVKIGEPAVKPLITALEHRDANVRASAAWVLGTLNDSRAVEPVIGALGDNDPAVRAAGAVALGQLNDRRAVEPLIGALRDRDMTARRAAATALGQLNDSRAVEPLIGALRDREGRVRDAAARALGMLKDERAVEPLIRALGDKDPLGGAAAAAIALGEIGDSRAVKPLIGLLEVGRSSKDDGSLRAFSVATALGKIGEPAVEPLIAILGHENSEARANAAMALGTTKDTRAVEPLIAALEDEDQSVRASAAGALGQIKDARAVEPLVAALAEGDANVTRVAVHALREMEADRAVEQLILVLRDGEAEKQVSAATILGDIGDNRAVEPLINALEDNNLRVRTAALKALAKIDDERVVEPLVAAVRGEVLPLRMDAISALGNVKDPRVIEPLIDALTDEEPVIREYAANSLQKLTGQNFGQDQAKWRAWWEENETGQINWAVDEVRVLRQRAPSPP